MESIPVTCSKGFGRRTRVSKRTGPALLLLALVTVFPVNAQPLAGSIATRPAPFAATVVDGSGNLYTAGTVLAGAYTPTSGAAQTQPGGGTCGTATAFFGVVPGPCSDAFIMKQDATGKTVFATYLGGPANDYAQFLAVDSVGATYLTGITGGSFPITAHAALANIPASGTFAAKLSADGSKVIYSTYLPAALTTVQAMALGGDGTVYVTGKSATGHAAIVKVSTDGSTFVYYRELAGSGKDLGYAIAVDPDGDAVIAGSTTSADFPVSDGALQARLLGLQNAFVAELNASGEVIFSTYLGGSGSDIAYGVQIDGTGNVYAGGSTTSIRFPTTTGSFDPAPVAAVTSTLPEGFIVKLAPRGASLIYGTYVVSSGGVTALTVDGQGEVYADGNALTQFPITPSAPQACLETIFLIHVDSHGGLLEATYLGSTTDFPFNGGLALGADGTAVMTAETTINGVRTPAVAQIVFGGPGWQAPACLSPGPVNAASFLNGGRVAPGQISTFMGLGIGPNAGVVYQAGPQGQAPLSLGGVQVFFDDQAAPVLYAQSQQVNVVAPFELAGRATTMVSLAYNDMLFGPFAVAVDPAAPALFSLLPGMSTQAAAINEDGTINGVDHPASGGSVVSLYGTGFGQTDPPCATGAVNPNGLSSLAPGIQATIDTPGSGHPVINYAGGAPTLLCGMTQINMVVPAGTPPGDFYVTPALSWKAGSTVTTFQGQVYATIVVR
jgi:uncharacterized protein (TIGR03437 family)